MIVFVLTAEHTYTHRPLVGSGTGVRVDLLTYDELRRSKTFPRATYVFTDMDRLPLWQVRSAAIAYGRLRDQGVRVLNNPARVTSRYGLLRQLHRAGINGFNAYRIEEGVKPERWPVFLRSEGDHLGPISDLLHGWDQVLRAVDLAIAKGIPLAGLLVVEFAAQPMRPDFWRKFGSFRMGKSEFAHCCVDDDHWVAKTGKSGITPPELYDEELQIARDNPYGPLVAPAFDLAGIEYGRADFGFVDGKAQIYEINTNPEIAFDAAHPSPVRLETYRVFKSRYVDALRAIDTPDAGPSVTIS